MSTTPPPPQPRYDNPIGCSLAPPSSNPNNFTVIFNNTFAYPISIYWVNLACVERSIGDIDPLKTQAVMVYENQVCMMGLALYCIFFVVCCWSV
jgi:hypothetical protein